ncbi:MAG TPA: molybdate ABC transporter substrate-binding protein [Candidatus Azoamicus sp. OHIO2]
MFDLQASNVVTLNIAVSSNFLTTFNTIANEFEKHFKFKINVCSDSTASLYNKIIHKAPFDIFISADAKHPVLLENIFFTKSFVYAYGNLVLYSRNFKKRKNMFRHVYCFLNMAVANKMLSPYGKASYNIIENLQIKIKKVVIGMNINQTYNFICFNSTYVGFVSLSHVVTTNIDKMLIWVVPLYLYPLIEQRIIPLKDENTNKSIHYFLNYFKTDEVKGIISRYGYNIVT